MFSRDRYEINVFHVERMLVATGVFIILTDGGSSSIPDDHLHLVALGPTVNMLDLTPYIGRP